MQECCRYCHQKIGSHPVKTKIGTFCSTEHYDEYLNQLSREEYIQLQHTFCVCSDDAI